MVTVPPYVSDPQQQTTKDAGAIFCFNVLRINEKAIATIAYELDMKVGALRNVLIQCQASLLMMEFFRSNQQKTPTWMKKTSLTRWITISLLSLNARVKWTCQIKKGVYHLHTACECVRLKQIMAY